MTLEQLIRLKDILYWAKRQCKTDGMYDSITAMEKIVENEMKEDPNHIRTITQREKYNR